jgi:membrane protein DedA with SNARE-associated domain
MSSFLTDQVATYGTIGILALMLLGSACVPIPSEVVLLFGGALASPGFAEALLDRPGDELSLAPVIVASLVGSMLGSWLSYAIGAVGGRAVIDRWGRYLLLRPHEVDRAHAWFARHGEATVFWSRMVPLARAFISLPAGVARMDPWRFSLYTFLGNIPWTLGLVLAGYALGEHWHIVDRFVQPVAIAIGALGAAALAWWLWTRVRARDADAAEPRRRNR